ncbi:hypothetical protein CSA80_02865 [Candidatus Saccharibacteria bacterium]|nr:MAG: hypothetical protein CSA80_02865 [Candidatus Saccharibacteria bacterium]
MMNFRVRSMGRFVAVFLAVYGAYTVVLNAPTASAALGDSSQPAKSCQQIKQANPAATDSLYWLQGQNMNSPQQYYCDMTTAGGGWQLIFQRAGGTNNTETCSGTQKAILNDFLHDGPCGDVNNLAYGDSYNADDVDATYANFSPVEYLNIQTRSNGVDDTDDAYILHTTANIFPNSASPSTVIDTPIDQICDVNNANCDNSDVYWKYIGNSWFHSSLCHAGNAAGNVAYHGNYGYCHNGWTGSGANALFGNRTGYNETKLYDHAGGSRHYAERFYIKSGNTPPSFDAINVTSNNAKNANFAKAGDDISVNLTLRVSDTWRNNYNHATFSIGSTTGLQTSDYPGAATPKLSDSVDYTVLAGQNGTLTFTALVFQNNDNLDITNFTAPYTPSSNIIVDTVLPNINFTDDVSASLTSSDAITITVADANVDPASYEYGFSPDATCDAGDTYGNAFTSGTTFNITSPANNGQYICVRAEDQAGNVSYKASANPLNIGQLTATPAAAPDLQNTSDSGFSDTDDITNDTTPTFTGSCIAGSDVKLYVDGVATVDTATCTAGGTFSITLSSPLSSGDYDITYTQDQNTPGYQESNQSPALTVTIDNIDPNNLVVQVDTAAPQDVDNPSITFTAVDNESGIHHYTVQVDGGAVSIQTSPYTPSLTPASAHTVAVVVYDVAGNSITRSVTYPPTVNINSPTVIINTTITDTTIIVNGSNPITSVAIGGVPYNNLACSPNPIPAGVAGPITCSLDITGSGTLTATAVDTIGSTGTASQTYTVETDSPVINFTQDVEPGPVQNDTIAISVTDSNPLVSSYQYGFSADATCDASDTYNTAFTSGTTFSITTESYNGQYICARAEDQAGNTSYQASANPLNIDVTAPTATFAFSETNPTNGNVTVTMTTSEAITTPAGWTQVTATTYTKTVTQNIADNFTITDPAGNATAVSYTVGNIDKQDPVITLNGSNPQTVPQGSPYNEANATCTDNTSCSVTISGSVDTNTTGNYTVTYTATDPAGNSTAITRTVQVLPDMDDDGIPDDSDPDIDGDGVSNILEIVYGTDPRDVNSRPRPTVDIAQSEPSSTNDPTFSDATMSVTGGLCNHISQVNSLPVDGIVPGDDYTIVAGVEFQLACGALGEYANVDFTLGSFYSQPELLRVYKRTNGQLVDITNQVTLQNVNGRTVLSYQLTDGQTHDEDNQTNARIIDPIYIGVPETKLSETGSNIYGNLAAALALMITSALVLKVRTPQTKE